MRIRWDLDFFFLNLFGFNSNLYSDSIKWLEITTWRGIFCLDTSYDIFVLHCHIKIKYSKLSANECINIRAHKMIKFYICMQTQN